MNIRIKILIVLLLAMACNAVLSQNNIKDYEYICYCTLIGANPRDIIETGNNWDLLLALKDGKTSDELDKSGIKYSQKQLDVLQAINFIKKQDGKYYSLITILNSKESSEIRSLTKDIAAKIVLQIHNDYFSFSNKLKEQGFERNTYTLFFSYVMDNLVWQKLEAVNAIPQQKITVEIPLWDGTVWFLHDKRKFDCGTNSSSFENLNIAINWSDYSGVSLSDIDNNVMEAILKDYKKNVIITDTSIKSLLLNYDLCKPSGKIKFPVIKKDTADKINVLSQNIANIISDYLIKNIDFSTVLNKFHIKSKSDAIIILYHEIMWDILDIMEEKGQIKKPVAFAQPKNCMPSDIKDLIFIYEE
ncbi:MAG: hypothetical protein ABR968_07935 [Bacteroidales bacterium]|jgi:hypothetical protein